MITIITITYIWTLDTLPRNACGCVSGGTRPIHFGSTSLSCCHVFCNLFDIVESESLIEMTKCANCAADAARPCYQWQRFLATSQRTPC